MEDKVLFLNGYFLRFHFYLKKKEKEKQSKTKHNVHWDFPGGPVIEVSPCQGRGPGLMPGQGTKILHVLSSMAKDKNRRNN